ncbi:MAG: hypothetical protein ACRC9H_05985 [Aeromonas veronii]
MAAWSTYITAEQYDALGIAFWLREYGSRVKWLAGSTLQDLREAPRSLNAWWALLTLPIALSPLELWHRARALRDHLDDPYVVGDPDLHHLTMITLLNPQNIEQLKAMQQWDKRHG